MATPRAGFVNQVQVDSYTDPTGKKRAKAPAQVSAQGGQTFTFRSNGPNIVFDQDNPSDPPGLFPNGVPAPSTTIQVTLPTVSHSTPFKWYATCGGADVEGNSPPIIIVEN